MNLFKLGTFVFAVFFAIQSITVYSAPSYCNRPVGPPYTKFEIDGVPQYFFKVTPDGEYLGYITKSGNQLIYFANKRTRKIPGKLDPVFSPDGKLMIVPDECMRFHDFQSVSQKLSTSISAALFGKVEIESLPKVGGNKNCIQGVYQSVGVRDPSSGKYTVITDHKGLQLHDFTYSGQQIDVVRSYFPCQAGYFVDGISSAFRVSNVSLPMMSKDGRYISYYDQKDKTTKVMRLDGNKCYEVMDFGYPTGKTEFSYDGNELTFHVGLYAPIAKGYFSGLEKSEAKDVLVMKLAKNNVGTPEESWIATQLARATVHTDQGTGGYYPSFDTRGNIYFAGLDNPKQKYYFGKVKREDLVFFDVADVSVSSCHQGDDQYFCEGAISLPLRLATIGEMWNAVCQEEKFTGLNESVWQTLTLTPEDCEKTVRAAWGEMNFDGKNFETLPKQVTSTLKSEMKIEHLLSVCQQFLNGLPEDEQKLRISKVPNYSGPATVNVPVGNVVSDPAELMPGADVFNTSCTNCHSGTMQGRFGGPIPPFEGEGLKPANYKRMAAQVKSGRMPLGGTLGEEEKQQLIEYLEAKSQ